MEAEWYVMKKSEEAWWRKADLNDLVFLKSLEHNNIDNCDLPLPKTNQTKEWLVHYDDKGLASFDPQTFTLQYDESKIMETQTQRPDSQLSKAELLEALRRSQRRAREAEKAAQEACKEKQHIITLFLKQASQIFAYKQWLYILHLETLCNHPDKGKRAHNKNKSIGDFVLGLALVGAGVLLGWTLGWFFHDTL